MLSVDLSRFFELSPDLCCVIAFDGTIKSVNVAWMSLLGYAEDAVRGQRFIDLLHPDDQPMTERELARQVSSAFTVRCRATDGRFRTVHWRSAAVVDSSTIYVVGRAEPIALSRAERLLSLGQVAVGVVHDLKNVLVHPLSLYLQRIERSLEANDVERARAATQAMRATLRDGLETIERMLHFSRASETAYRTRIDLDGVVWRATEIGRAYMRSVTPIKQVDISYAPTELDWIEADGFELLAALVNVLLNAVDAVDERDGKIEVRAGNGDRMVWIEVVDNGPGMTEQVRDRIFEPFFSTKHEGVGIGLAMVKASVDRHGGALRVESTPGVGTTFRIELPVTPAAK